MTDRPNIVLVTVDSLRADHCGFMGYEKNTTPTLDRMAEEGLVFKNAIAPGPTTPASMPVVFTGEYPAPREQESKLQRREKPIEPHMSARETIAERLSQRDYTTIAFTPNPWTSRHFGFDQGFDQFCDFLDEDRSSTIWERIMAGKESKPLVAIRLLASWLQRENTFKPWDSFYDSIIDQISRAEEPYFLWVFLLDSHYPYFSSDSDRTQSRWRAYEANLRLYLESQTTPYSPRVHTQLVTAYDDSIRYVDRFLNRLQTELEPHEPTIIIHGDHGEAFGEHGTYGHHYQFYEPNLHVPLVISDAVEKTVSSPVSLSTLPELLTSIADGKTELSATARRPWCSVGGGPAVIRGPTWKFIRDKNNEIIYQLPLENREINSSDLIDMANSLANRWTETREEQRRIIASVDDLCDKERL